MMPHTIDPGHWLPEVLLYTDAQQELWAVRRDKVTWSDLVRASEYHRIGRDRAWKRRQSPAYTHHGRLHARLRTVMETFGPLMQANPTLGFADACARMTRQSLNVVKEL
jgi:hypothetical protein